MSINNQQKTFKHTKCTPIAKVTSSAKFSRK